MDHQQAHGIGYSIDWNGRKIKLSLNTDEVKAAFTAAAKQNAIAEFDELKALLVKPDGKPDTERIAEEWQAVREALITGRFQWGGKLATAWLEGYEGGKTWLRLLMLFGGSDLMDDKTLNAFMRAKKEEIKRMLELIAEESEPPKEEPPTVVAAK